MCPPFWIVGRKRCRSLKESISKRLHDHSFINILFYLPSDSHWTHLRSCARPGANIWLLTHPIFFYFAYLKMFSLLHCALGWVFPILYSLGCRTTFVASFWILWGCIFFTAHMLRRRQLHMMLCNMFLWPLRENWDFMFHKSKPMSFCSQSFSFCVVELRLYY